FGEAVGLKNVKLYHLLGYLQNRDAPLTPASVLHLFSGEHLNESSPPLEIGVLRTEAARLSCCEERGRRKEPEEVFLQI
ncbi:hypothetical protein QUB75_16310, partial [Microcoleus sp. K1-B6]|uniref:hypothetical protein n=1 Tax=unclassified Microcoleus TaxID=2642155 RepID=UPI002FD59C10